MLPLRCFFLIACLILPTQYVVGATKKCPRKLLGAKHVRQASIENGLPCQVDSDCIGGKCYPKWSETSHQHVNICCSSMPGEKKGIGEISCCGNNMSCLSSQRQPCHCVHAYLTPQDNDLCRTKSECSNWGCDINRNEQRRCCSAMTKGQFCDNVYVYCCRGMACWRGTCIEFPPRKTKLKCKCNGTALDPSECTSGSCTGDVCRTRAFCKDKPMTNMNCATTVDYVYDCVNVHVGDKWEGLESLLGKIFWSESLVIKHCSTHMWWNTSVECCYNPVMCNERLKPRIGLKKSNRIFYNPWIYGHPVKAPDGYPCDTPSDCLSNRGVQKAWCHEKWSDAIKGNSYDLFRPARHIKVCCSAQLGSKCSSNHVCCGSYMICHQQKGICRFYSPRKIFAKDSVTVAEIGALDGIQCHSHTECATSYCHTLPHPTAQNAAGSCCYGYYLGSYCNEALGLRCCHDAQPAYCENNICTPRGPGRLCHIVDTGGIRESSGCYDSICKVKQLTRREGEKVDVKVCCSGYQLETQACESCALSNWDYFEPCDTCCVGYCDNGLCSNIGQSYCENLVNAFNVDQTSKQQRTCFARVETTGWSRLFHR